MSSRIVATGFFCPSLNIVGEHANGWREMQMSPVAAMVLILGIDRFMAERRSLVNVIGNAVAVVVVSAWEGELDRSMMHAVLSESGINVSRLMDR